MSVAYPVPFSTGDTIVIVECLDAQGRVRVSMKDWFHVRSVLDAELSLPIAYRSDGVVRVQGRVALPTASLKGARVEVVLQPGVARAPATVDAATGALSARVPVSKLKPGRYQVLVRLTAPRVAKTAFVRRLALRVLKGPLE